MLDDRGGDCPLRVKSGYFEIVSFRSAKRALADRSRFFGLSNQIGERPCFSGEKPMKFKSLEIREG